MSSTSTIWVSVFPGTIRGLSHLSLALLSLVVDVDSESEAMSSTIWVSVFPGTIGGLSHLSLASLSSVVSCLLASSFFLIQSFLLFSSLFFCDGLFFFLFLFTSMEIEQDAESGEAEAHSPRGQVNGGVY